MSHFHSYREAFKTATEIDQMCHTIPTHVSKQSLLDKSSEVVWRGMDCQVVYSEVAKLADRGLQCRIVDYAGSGFCLTDVESGERICPFHS